MLVYYKYIIPPRAFNNKHDYSEPVGKKKGIMLVYTACISIIISVVCVGYHPLLYWGERE